MKTLHLLLAVACVIACLAFTTTAQPALQTSINAGALTNLINTLLPRVFEEFKHTQFPDENDGHKHITNISINDIGLDEFAIGADPNGWINLVCFMQ